MDIKRLLEDALAAVIADKASDTALEDVPVYKGLCMREQGTPRIEVVCPKSAYEYIGGVITNSHLVDGHVYVVSHNADATRDSHGEAVGTVERILREPDLASMLSNSGHGVEVHPNRARLLESADSMDESEVVTEIKFTMYVSERYAPDVYSSSSSSD